jgi:hypothetical protein
MFLAPISQSFAILSNPTIIRREVYQNKGCHIYSYSEPSVWSVFNYMQSFDLNVWLSILFSFISICVFLFFTEKSIHKIQNTIWRYISILLSEPFPHISYRKAIKMLSQRIMLSVWLLSCTVLLAAFSGVLRNFFINYISSDIIDTYQQLYSRSDLKIITTYERYFDLLVQNYKSENYMLKDFSNRLFYYNEIDILKQNLTVMEELVSKIKTKKYVLVMKSEHMDSIIHYSNNKWTEIIGKQFYVSNEGFNIIYYSIDISRMNHLKSDFNIL